VSRGCRWDALDAPPPASVRCGAVELRAGSRVRLRPAAGGDPLGRELAGRTAVVEAIDQDLEGAVHVAVVLDGDPGRDLGRARMPGHRFYFAPDELEPLAAPGPRLLVAGLGNVFLGDDGFGVEVVRRLAGRDLGPGVDVVDFGIRGLDLVHALESGYDAVVLVDAAPRGAPPGTLHVVEPELGETAPAPLLGHALDPARALALARALGARLGPVRVVGCEPARTPPPDLPPEAMSMELGAAVRAAVPAAVDLVAAVVDELRAAIARRDSARDEEDATCSDAGSEGSSDTATRR